MNIKQVLISASIVILTAFSTIFAFSLVQAQSPATSFDFPLGDGTYDYGTIVWPYGNPSEIVEDTRYGIRNPDLGPTITCFGEPWNNIYHAGEDWYRFDKNTGEMLDTTGVEVQAVGNGVVFHKSDPSQVWYPGRAVIVEHILSPPRNGYDKIYSLYMHLEDTFVSEGQEVSKGTPIGTVISQTWTGTNPDPTRPSYDSHLHWEMRYFPDASNIYDSSTTCNGRVAGRGYTYPEHPDDFPADEPYTNPSQFVRPTVYLPLVMKRWPPIPYTPVLNPINNPSYASD